MSAQHWWGNTHNSDHLQLEQFPDDVFSIYFWYRRRFRKEGKWPSASSEFVRSMEQGYKIRGEIERKREGVGYSKFFQVVQKRQLTLATVILENLKNALKVKCRPVALSDVLVLKSILSLSSPLFDSWLWSLCRGLAPGPRVSRILPVHSRKPCHGNLGHELPAQIFLLHVWPVGGRLEGPAENRWQHGTGLESIR